jgi:hypothetical protein
LSRSYTLPILISVGGNIVAALIVASLRERMRG